MTFAVLVVGGGRLGAALARRTHADGHEVTVVEPDDARAAVVAGTSSIRVVTGRCTDVATLESAGIRTAEVVAAVSGDDADNLVVCALARFEYGAARTVARIVDPTHAWLFDEVAGVDTALDQSELLARLIAEEVPPEPR